MNDNNRRLIEEHLPKQAITDKAARRRAEERLARKDVEDVDVEKAQAAMRRSMIRLRVAQRRSRRAMGPKTPQK